VIRRTEFSILDRQTAQHVVDALTRPFDGVFTMDTNAARTFGALD
jgi:hypothetical protein